MDHFHSSCGHDFRSLHKTIGLRLLNVRCIKSEKNYERGISCRYEKNYVVAYGTHAIPSCIGNWNYHYRLLRIYFKT